MTPLTPLRFILVCEGRVSTARILERVFEGLVARRAWEFQCYYVNEMEWRYDEVGVAVDAADAVLFLRSSRPEELEVMRRAQGRGIPALYCTDDDFDALDPETPLGKAYAEPERRAAREAFAREADLVWLFTEEMASRFARFTDRIHVGRLPSFVEQHGWNEAEIEAAEREPEILTIGYGGRFIHSPDLEVIVAPLTRILETFPRPVRAEFIDCVPPSLEGHPRVQHLPYFNDIQDYYDYVRHAGWALGLAPLKDTLGNRAKTNNKYREYAALGVPSVYSDMPVYASSVRHRETGYLAPHTEEGYYQAMCAMLGDQELSRSIRRNALADAATTYALLPMQQEWLREVTRLASRGDRKTRLLLIGHDRATTTHVDALPACRALAQAGRLDFDYVQPMEATRAQVAGAEAVVVVRAFHPENISTLDWAKDLDVPLICSYDDDFFSLPRDTDLGRYYRTPGVRKAVCRFLQECSLVASSTPPLTERTRELTPHFMEALYGFDTAHLPLPRPRPAPEEEGRPVRIGFFGATWAQSLPCITEALRRVKARFGTRVSLEIITLNVPPEMADLFDWKSEREMEWAAILQLLETRGWDIGMAPLENTEFNASKQATKFRDYAWADLAMICSRVPTYERVIIDGIHGLLVDNTEEAWEAGLSRLIEDRVLRDRLRASGRSLFELAYTLEATICSWEQLLWRIVHYRERRPAVLQAPAAAPPESFSRPAEPSVSEAPVGQLHATRPLEGERQYALVAQEDGWQAVELMLGLHARPATGRLVLTIYPEGQTREPLRQVAGDLSQAADNGWFRFAFPSIQNSRGRSFLVRLALEGAPPGTRVSPYEQGQPPRHLLARLLRRVSRRGGRLHCRLGYQG